MFKKYKINKILEKISHYNRLSKQEYFELRSQIEKYQDSNQLYSVMGKLTKYICGINDINISYGLTASLNDVFVLNDTLYVVTHKPGKWIGVHGVLIDTIEKEVQMKIILIEDIWLGPAEVHNHKILNSYF